MSERVLVLAGGLSHERDVSLRSGRRVAEALRDRQFDVEVRDVDSTLLPWLREDPPACVLPLLHGATGEDGAIREVLELAGTPYVGSRPVSSRLAFDKPIAKALLEAAGAHTPASVVLPHEAFRELGAGEVMKAIAGRLGFPMIVKPARGGSALGCTVVYAAEDLPSAMVDAFAYGDTALVERLIVGYEVAVAVIDDEDGLRALPAVGIRPDGGVYDYTARYTAGSTEFDVPARWELLPEDRGVELAAACADLALLAHRTLGLRDLSRTDMIVDSSGTVWFLEVNVAPGMTETSLVPLAVEASGRDLGEVVGRLVRSAAARH